MCGGGGGPVQRAVSDAEREAKEREALAKRLNEEGTKALGRRRRMRAQSLLASGGADASGNLTIGTASAKPTLGA